MLADSVRRKVWKFISRGSAANDNGMTMGRPARDTRISANRYCYCYGEIAIHLAKLSSGRTLTVRTVSALGNLSQTPAGASGDMSSDHDLSED